MDLWTSDVNYLAVALTALLPMLLGTFWYATFGFGRIWLRLIGRTLEEISAEGGAAKGYISTMVGALVLSYGLAQLTRFAGSESFVDGLVLGLWIWVGAIATTSLGVYVFAGPGLRLWAFNNAYHLVAVPLMAAILTVWK